MKNIKEFEDKKGQVAFEETPAEKGISIFLLLLFVVLIVLLIYLIYRLFVSGTFENLVRFFRWRW